MERGVMSQKSAQLETLIAKRDVQGIWSAVKTLDELPIDRANVKTIEFYHFDLLIKAMFSLLYENTQEDTLRNAFIQRFGRKRGGETFGSSKDYIRTMKDYSRLMVYEVYRRRNINEKGKIVDKVVTLLQKTDVVPIEKPRCIGDNPDAAFNIPFPSIDQFLNTSIALLHPLPTEIYPYRKNPSVMVYLYRWENFDDLKNILSDAKLKAYK